MGFRLIARDGAAGVLLGGVMGLVGEHPLFGAAAATTFLAANLLDAVALGGDEAVFEGLNLVEQQAAGQEAVEALLAGGLAFDLQSGRAVEQHDAGGGLIDILAAVPAGTDKGFVNVGLAHTERRHALVELGLFVGTDGERVHGRKVTGGTAPGNATVSAVQTRS
jgi:hypothetical protein